MGFETRVEGSLAQPVAFEGCAGWLHPAGGDVAALLLSPWGFEALCMRRAWRMLAVASAPAISTARASPAMTRSAASASSAWGWSPPTTE